MSYWQWLSQRLPVAQALKETNATQNPHLVADQIEVEQFLSAPSTYGPNTDHIDRVDTYGAMLFMTPDRVIKVKKAVKYPYMDFSTLEKRRAACFNEIKLNRPTAPSIYIGVCAVARQSDGSLALIRDGLETDKADIIEWGVEMHRFDEDQRLDHLAERHVLTDQMLLTLSDKIAEFHTGAPIYREEPDFFSAMQKIIRENTDAFREFPTIFSSARVDTMTGHLDDWMARKQTVFHTRQEKGYIRHCHGDLHLANLVCVDGEPTLFDALEFDDNMARIDVAYDLAFLLMDLLERGHGRSANLVFNRYLSATSDLSAVSLLPLYLSVRAAIRAKIAAAENNHSAAETYFRFAEKFLAHHEPVLVAIGGLSGTGKSTVAREVASFVGAPPGAVVLRSDVLRKQIFDVSETETLPSSAYTDDTSQRVYALLHEKAAEVLSYGQSVIMDAVYHRPNERETAQKVAATHQASFFGIWLEAPPPTLKARVDSRTGDASDADARVVVRQLDYDVGVVTWSNVLTDAPLEIVAQRVKSLLPLNELQY